jgi:hypothetical protein
MSTFRLSVYARYLIIPVLAWATSLVAAECAFRLLGDATTEDKLGFFVQFEDGSYKLRPHADFGAKYASGPFSLYTDDLGLRCDAARTHAVKNGDAVDILFIGDSQGFGNGVNYEETIAGGVAELAGTKRIRVANASVGGHALRNQLELARWLHDQQSVRVSHYVILLTPLMVMTACDDFSRAVVGTDGRLYDKTKSAAEMAIIWLKTHSVTYPRFRDAVRNTGIGVNPSGDVPFVFRIFDARSDEEESMRKLACCLAEFRDLAARDGATLSLVYLPLTIEVDFAPVRQAAEAKNLKLDPDVPVRVCAGTAAKLGIPLYNIRPVLEKARAQGQRLHLKADFHYDAILSRACAQYLWQYIGTSTEPNTNNTLHPTRRENAWKSRR